MRATLLDGDAFGNDEVTIVKQVRVSPSPSLGTHFASTSRMARRSVGPVVRLATLRVASYGLAALRAAANAALAALGG